MGKNRISIVILVILIGLFFGYNYYQEKEDGINEEGVTFKQEFEKYNGKKDENGNDYPNVIINDDNVVKYSSYGEVFNILESGSGVILIGSPTSASTREIIESVIGASVETNLDIIYYLNVEKDADEIKIENDNVVISKKGTKNYQQLLKKLDLFLNSYSVDKENGEVIESDIKKIDLPMLIFVKDGTIQCINKGIVDHYDPYVPLTDLEKENLLLELIDDINMVYKEGQ